MTIEGGLMLQNVLLFTFLKADFLSWKTQEAYSSQKSYEKKINKKSLEPKSI